MLSSPSRVLIVFLHGLNVGCRNVHALVNYLLGRSHWLSVFQHIAKDRSLIKVKLKHLCFILGSVTVFFWYISLEPITVSVHWIHISFCDAINLCALLHKYVRHWFILPNNIKLCTLLVSRRTFIEQHCVVFSWNIEMGLVLSKYGNAENVIADVHILVY